MRTAIQFELSSPLVADSAALAADSVVSVALVASVLRVLLRVVSVHRASVRVRASVLRLLLLR